MLWRGDNHGRLYSSLRAGSMLIEQSPSAVVSGAYAYVTSHGIETANGLF